MFVHVSDDSNDDADYDGVTQCDAVAVTDPACCNASAIPRVECFEEKSIFARHLFGLHDTKQGLDRTASSSSIVFHVAVARRTTVRAIRAIFESKSSVPRLP